MKKRLKRLKNKKFICLMIYCKKKLLVYMVFLQQKEMRDYVFI